uniref:hypothetical protein n=1 Tax=Polaromonas sp. YR568 TaxID=1855301 RepID=UPI003137B76A
CENSVKRQKWRSLRRQASSAERNLALRATSASLVGYRATDSRLDQTFLNGIEMCQSGDANQPLEKQERPT